MTQFEFLRSPYSLVPDPPILPAVSNAYQNDFLRQVSNLKGFFVVCKNTTTIACSKNYNYQLLLKTEDGKELYASSTKENSLVLKNGCGCFHPCLCSFGGFFRPTTFQFKFYDNNSMEMLRLDLWSYPYESEMIVESPLSRTLGHIKLERNDFCWIGGCGLAFCWHKRRISVRDGYKNILYVLVADCKMCEFCCGPAKEYIIYNNKEIEVGRILIEIDQPLCSKVCGGAKVTTCKTRLRDPVNMNPEDKLLLIGATYYLQIYLNLNHSITYC